LVIDPIGRILTESLDHRSAAVAMFATSADFARTEGGVTDGVTADAAATAAGAPGVPAARAAGVPATIAAASMTTAAAAVLTQTLLSRVPTRIRSPFAPVEQIPTHCVSAAVQSGKLLLNFFTERTRGFRSCPR
jgi:hypothetical protein